MYAAQLQFYTLPEIKTLLNMLCDAHSPWAQKIRPGHSDLCCTRYRMHSSIAQTMKVSVPGPPLCPIAIITNPQLSTDLFLCRECKDATKSKAHMQALLFYFIMDNPYWALANDRRQFYAKDTRVLQKITSFYNHRQDQQLNKSACAFVSYRVALSQRDRFYRTSDIEGRVAYILLLQPPTDEVTTTLIANLRTTAALSDTHERPFLMLSVDNQRIQCVALPSPTTAAHARRMREYLEPSAPPWTLYYPLALHARAYGDGYRYSISVRGTDRQRVFNNFPVRVRFDEGVQPQLRQY